jgi:hypothetical protein
MYNVYMIQITAYLRNEEDLAKWKLLENKTEWLHKQLAGQEGVPTSRRTSQSTQPKFESRVWAPSGTTVQPPTPIEQSVLDSLPVFKASDLPIKLCTHGSNPKFCKHAKNGKPCK